MFMNSSYSEMDWFIFIFVQFYLLLAMEILHKNASQMVNPEQIATDLHSLQMHTLNCVWDGLLKVLTCRIDKSFC